MRDKGHTYSQSVYDTVFKSSNILVNNFSQNIRIRNILNQLPERSMLGISIWAPQFKQIVKTYSLTDANINEHSNELHESFIKHHIHEIFQGNVNA